WKMGLACGIAALMAIPAAAQPGPGGRGGGLGMLLRNKSVQQELKLNDDQVKKLDAALTKVRDAHKDEFDKLRDMKEDERTAFFKKLNEENMKAASDTLNADQIKRLKQIQVQQDGLRAFSDADVQKALNLKDDQKDKIKTISEDARKDIEALFPRGQP